MSTKWVVTAAAERIALDQARSGETTFTVTNPTSAADRVMFDPVAGDGADEGWFTVDEPQRLVRGGASVSYLLKVAVPADTAPGAYEVQGRVYSADSAPEESSVLSSRVAVEVPAEPEPDQRKVPWWWWLVAAGVAVVLLVVLGIVLFGGGGDDQAEPVPSPAVGEILMPELLGSSEREALRVLSEAGLTVRPIRYRHDPEQDDKVVDQSPGGDSVVSQDAVVDLVVAVDLPAPEITGPVGTPAVAPEAEIVLDWEAERSPARQWRVTLFPEECVLGYSPDRGYHRTECQFPETGHPQVVQTTTYTPQLDLDEAVTPVGSTFHTGWVRWHVEALDDDLSPGPASEPGVFRMVVQP